MSPSAQQPRPPQVTFSGWLVVGGSVIVLLGAFEAMAALRTLETREMLQQFLAEAPGSSLGLSFEGAREMRRVAILVLGACATAAAVLGFLALRRDRFARVVLSVLAVPIFVAGSIAGGFASAVVTVSIVMLWLEPARSWFAGRPLPERFRLPREGGAARRDRDRPDPFAVPPRHDQQPGQPGQPGPHGKAGQSGQPDQHAPHGQHAQPGPQAQPWGPPPAGQPTQAPWGGQPAPYQGFGEPQRGPWGPAPAGRHSGGYGGPVPPRPAAVLVAAVLTWVATTLVTVAMVVLVVVVASSPDQLMDEIRATQPDLVEQGVTSDLLLSTAVTMAIVMIAWAVASAVFAAYALRGAGWARVALVISAGVAAVLGVVAALAAPQLVLFVLAAAVTAGSLLRRDVGRWYDARGRMGR